MTDLAINDKGEALFFDGKDWKPATIAQNDKGDRMAFDGQGWRALPATEKPGAISGALKAADDVLDTVNRNIINPIGTGLTKGVTNLLGAGDAAGTLAQQGAAWAGDKLGAPETGKTIGKAAKSALTFHGLMPNTAAMNRTVFGDLGVPEENYGDKPALTLTNPFGIEGKVNVGKMIDTGIQAIPGSMALGGGALPALAGGATSEAAGQATEGTPWEIPARIFGALPGAWVGSKLATPLPANLTPQQARAVQIAKDTGTPLSVAQETGRGGAMERLFARMPGGMGPSERFTARQGAVTDEAALAQAGFKGSELGQETMKSVGKQAGAKFDAAKKMPGVIDLKSTFPRVRESVAKYEGVMDPARRSPAVTTEANRILSKEATGKTAYPPLTASAVDAPSPTLANLTAAVKNASKPIDEAFDALPSVKIKEWFTPGAKVPKPKDLPELSSEQYQTLRKGLTEAIDGLYSAKDTNGARALQSMRTSLDDAVEASLGGEKLAKWREARRHYFNFKILQKSMNMGTASARSEGTLGANALTSALRRAQGDKFYETTGGLNDIATLKTYLRDTFPNSGTPTVGAQALAFVNPLLAGAPAAAMNLGARGMTGGGPLSSVVRNYLANQNMPSRLESVRSVPFALAPGVLTDQRISGLLSDQRGRR